jgi:hypothetical protein
VIQRRLYTYGNCVIEGCSKLATYKTPVHCCSLHYKRWWRYGNFASKYGQGTITPDGYRVIRVNGKSILEHRHIMEQFLGRKLLPNEVVHHKNGNKLDNSLENLEVLDHADHARLHFLNRCCPRCRGEIH